jgi:hypothetical protein
LCRLLFDRPVYVTVDSVHSAVCSPFIIVCSISVVSFSLGSALLVLSHSLSVK